MDKIVGDGRAPALRFGPDRRLTALIGLASVGALASAFAAPDRPGQLLFALAVIVLLGYVLGDLIFWPRLYVDAGGIRVRTPLARMDLPWVDIDDVRADLRTRHGLRSATLEVDAGQTLVVFSRRSLGADPTAVRDLVRAFASDQDRFTP